MTVDIFERVQRLRKLVSMAPILCIHSVPANGLKLKDSHRDIKKKKRKNMLVPAVFIATTIGLATLIALSKKADRPPPLGRVEEQKEIERNTKEQTTTRKK